MKPIFAFCGPIGSGKSSVSKTFAKEIGARWNSFGNAARDIAQERNITVNREALQKLGAQLIEHEREMFCMRVLTPLLGSWEQSGIIDGLRHADVLGELRALVSPRQILCVYVDVAPDVRLERVGKRDGLDEHELGKLDDHSTEVQVKTELRKLADFVANNNGTPEECVSHILNWARL